MSKVLPVSLFTFIFLLSFVILPKVEAAQSLADGNYSIDYTILKADNDSASMANDYLQKPAKVMVENGVANVQVTLKNSEWIKSFDVPGGSTKVVSKNEAANTRVIQFTVKDLSQKIAAKMHVDIKEMDYNHHYTVRFSFNEASLKATDAAKSATTTKSEANSTTEKTTKQPEAKQSKQTNASNGEVTKVTNPKTGDTAQFGLFLILFVGASIFLVRQIQFKNN